MNIERISCVGEKLDVSAALSDPWVVATRCSWRRILTRSGRAVCIPTNHPDDSHPDLLADHGVLQLMASSPQLYESTLVLRDALMQVLAGNPVKNVEEVLSFANQSLAEATKKVY